MTLHQLSDKADQHDVAWLKQQFVAGYQNGRPRTEMTNPSVNASVNTTNKPTVENFGQ